MNASEQSRRLDAEIRRVIGTRYMNTRKILNGYNSSSDQLETRWERGASEEQFQALYKALHTSRTYLLCRNIRIAKRMASFQKTSKYRLLLRMAVCNDKKFYFFQIFQKREKIGKKNLLGSCQH